MGRRGPPPKPTALKLAAGNPGRRKLNVQDEPKPEPGAGAPPDWLGDDARAIWFQLAPPMTRSGLATTVDERTLGRYCVLLALWIRASKACQKAQSQAYPTKNRKGQITGHRELPAFAELRRLGPQLLQLEREFGLTPAARTRIRLERDAAVAKGADPETSADQFFSFRRSSSPQAPA